MGLRVFISYATIDSKAFMVSKIANALEKFPEIDDVLIWEKDTKEDIIDYMNENLEICDILLLFCSENALVSDPVKLEWKTAIITNKIIIPVFNDPKDIPTLLKSKLGVKYNGNIESITEELHKIIIKSKSKDKITSYNNKYKKEIGFCIRCRIKVPYNLDKPYCYDCFNIWRKYENYNYQEGYCHECGKDYSTTIIYPRCNECYFK